MPNITFMRHARTTYNTERRFAGSIDCDTTEAGLKVAKNNFKYTDKDFDYVYCSPLKRTIQTLDAIMPNHGEVIIDQRIAERYLGEWENMYYDSISENLKEAYSKGYYNPPKSETFADVKKRVCSFVEELFQKHKDTDRILVVSHAGVIRQIRDNFLPDMDKSSIKNASTLIVTNEDFDRYIDEERKEGDLMI